MITDHPILLYYGLAQKNSQGTLKSSRLSRSFQYITVYSDM